jgi:acyl carrier protein
MTLSETEIRSKIFEFLKTNFFLDTIATPITDMDSFLEKGIIDSTGVLEVINFIQNDFGVEVLDEEILPENIDSVSNIVSYLARKMQLAA